ncbi:transporter [Novymonas esmeraldas]|uniref:Transporter n=1 Tax=Novymonas esmeraldas TaxID=1808958 RepID=A0AAW0F4Z4_9TRYP
MIASAATPVSAAQLHVRRAKVTPLPIRQLTALTFVIVNESICSTMLMPFVGPLVAKLRGIPVNEAGYYSGMMIGMFMIGQVISAKTWGYLSDKYGRRFPIISGLFTSGLMMLGFGLSTNVWLLALFRFLHGLFNGNVLVAKTMMADITDKTNQAGGFSFMSLCNAFGFLIGPTLGGLLYDPCHSKGLAWADFKEDGFLGTHPAFLPSLVVFIYTNIGMVVCTLFVQESNPKAQPLPGFMRLVYPCLWYKLKPFVLPPIQYETDDDEDDETAAAEDAVHGAQAFAPVTKGGPLTSTRRDERSTEANVPPNSSTSSTSATRATAAATAHFSPVAPEDDRRYDHMTVEDLVVLHSASRRPSAVLYGDDDGSSRRSSRHHSRDSSPCRPLTARREYSGAVVVPARGSAGVANAGEDDKSSATATAKEPRATSGAAARASENLEMEESEEEHVTTFGYREAFARPYTRFMLTQYMVLCATDMVARDSFPLWAVATASAGGLGLSTSQVSYILLANSAPCLAANILFRVVERYYTNKMGLFRVGVSVGGTAVALLPLNSYLPGGLWIYFLVFLCTATRQVCISWCYSLNTMLTARSAPPGHVGSIMGINQSCGSLVRGCVPFIAAPLFAWSISGSHPFPFDHVLVFALSATAFYFCWWRSYRIRTDEDGYLQMVE